MPDQTTILDPGIEYSTLMARWELPRDLSGGTLTMRGSGTKWLPKEPAETPVEYGIRRDRSILFNGFRSAISRTSSRPFSRDVMIRDVERLSFDGAAFATDVDLAGTSITDFARTLYEDAATYGISRFVIDWDERTRSPYWRHISALDCIGWQFGEDGRTLTDVRIRGSYVAIGENNQWSESMVETVRRYYVSEGAVYTELWESVEKSGRTEAQLVGDPVLITDSRGEPLGDIPLVTLYFNRTGNMLAEPPFEDLAWLNLGHWQSASDQSNILRYARVPMLAATGVDDTEDESEQPSRVTASQLLTSRNSDARFYFVEPQGTAIAAGREDLRHLEEQMERFGTQPNSRKAGVQTATGQFLDEQAHEGVMAAWSRSIETALTLGLWWCERWYGMEMAPDVIADVHDDRSLTPGRESKAKAILDAYKQALIRRVTALSELQLAGVLSEDIDTEQEAELAEQENRSIFPGMIGDEAFADDDEDGEDAEPVEDEEPITVSESDQ